MNRIATFKQGTNADALIIEIGGTMLKIQHSELGQLTSANAIKTELTRQASLGNKQLPELFIHVNRDGSLALATGHEPPVWPENYPEEEK